MGIRPGLFCGTGNGTDIENLYFPGSTHALAPRGGGKAGEKTREGSPPRDRQRKKAEEEPKGKRKPGRPKGSKNRQKGGEEVFGIKRGPGRPKGSKNKKGAVNAKLKRAEQKELHYKEHNPSSDSIWIGWWITVLGTWHWKLTYKTDDPKDSENYTLFLDWWESDSKIYVKIHCFVVDT